MIWTRQEDEEKERIKHAEYVAQWEQENARVLPRDGRSGDPNPPPRVMMSAHSVEGEQEKPLPRQEVDNG